MIPDPKGKGSFVDLACRESKNNRRGFCRWHFEIDAVQAEKNDECGESGALIAVNERRIAGDAECIGPGKRSKVHLSIGKSVERSGKRALQKAEITNALRTAEQSQLLAMNIKDDIYVEP